MSEWTPGPWTTKSANNPIDGEFDWCISATIDGVPRIIGEAYGRAATNVRPNAEANARLISAAPDMAEALAKCIEHLRCVRLGYSTISPEDVARAALAKARGETP